MASDKRIAGASRALLRDVRSAAIHEAFDTLTEGLAALGERHKAWLAPQALAPAQQLAVMRHISGVVLRPMAAPDASGHRREIAQYYARRHLRAIGYCLARLESDRKASLRGIVDGPLLGLEPLDGDPHRGGQRAVALHFAEGPELIYKSRDIRIDWFVAGSAPWNGLSSAARELNASLTRRGHPSVPTHLIVPVSDTHGYVERIGRVRDPIERRGRDRFDGILAGPVDPLRGLRLRSLDDAVAFWGAAGALAGQLALCGVSDQHAENLLLGASMDSPAPRLHAIDCEVAFTAVASVGRTHLVPPRFGALPEPADGPHTHYGLDARAVRFCGLGLDPWSLTLGGDGRLELVSDRVAHIARSSTSIVVNPDRTTGYASHVGAVIRGFVEHWRAARTQRRDLEALARRALRGARVRVLRKDTACYLAAIRARESGAPFAPHIGRAFADEDVLAFDRDELEQLDRLDVPAFDRTLGEDRIGWIEHPPSGRLLVDGAVPPQTARWWSCISRNASAQSLALSVAELAAFVTPAGPVDVMDEVYGVRIVRSDSASAVQVVIRFPRGNAQIRLDADGGATHWGIPE